MSDINNETPKTVDWVVPGSGEIQIGPMTESQIEEMKKYGYVITPIKIGPDGKPITGRIDRIKLQGMPAPKGVK